MLDVLFTSKLDQGIYTEAKIYKSFILANLKPFYFGSWYLLICSQFRESGLYVYVEIGKGIRVRFQINYAM